MQVVNEVEYITKTKYVAEDGRRFDSEEDCIKYEKRTFEVIKAWRAIPKLEYGEESLHLGGGYRDVHYIVCCRNQEDVDAANAYIEECAGYTKERFTEECIGKRIIISVWEVDSHGFGDEVVFFGEPTNVLKDMADLLYAPIQLEEECANE